MKKLKLVLIDDDAEFLNESKEMLEQTGYEVLCMKDSEYTVEKLRFEKPDVILLDVKMRVKSGLQIAFEIKKDPALKFVPIIAMSALYPDNNFMAMCGIKEKLNKPFFPADVIESVGRVI